MTEKPSQRASELFSPHVDFSGAATDEALDAAELHEDGQREHVERALTAIPSVVTARIVPGFERTIDELHVLATTGRPPKTIVRDVTSLLFAHFGLSIDHRVVSVVQIDKSNSAVGGVSRPSIERVVATQQGLSTTLIVDLALAGDAYRGDAEGPSSAAGRRRATARAALSAVRPLLAEDAMVEVEGVDVADIAGRHVAITLVHFHTGRGGQTVAGSAIVLADENVAVARSVLDAVNRFIEHTTN